MRITCIVVSCVALIYSTGIYAKCAPWTDSEVLKVHKAESIFIARIVSAHIKDIPSQGTILYGDYRLVETLKGKPKESGQLGMPPILWTPR